MNAIKIKLILIAVVAMFAFDAGAVNAVTLVKNGQPTAVIVIPVSPTPKEQEAAAELQKYIMLMSGAELVIKSGDEPESDAVIIGRHPFAVNLVGNLLNDETLGYDGIILKTSGNKLVVIGNNGKGQLYAVYQLLERLGCRFYLPHPDGEVVPKCKTIFVNGIDYLHKPSFINRDFWGDELNGPKLGYPELFSYRQTQVYLGGVDMSHGHNYAGFCSPDQYFATHPEYFPLINQDGKMQRVRTGQLCLSNPDVVRLAADNAIRSLASVSYRMCASLSPNDERGWCECEKCKAMDSPDPKVGVAWRALKFNNEVAEIVSKQFPERMLAYYAEYINFPGPPIGMKADRMILPVIVNQYDIVHSIYDPFVGNSVKTGVRYNADYVKVFDEWCKIVNHMLVYEWYDFPKHPLPSPMLYTTGERIKFYKDHKVIGYCGQIIGRSPVTDLTIYVASQLLWDSSQDADKLIDEYYDLYFAESGRYMRDFYRMLHEPSSFQSKFRGFFVPAKAWSPQLIARLYQTLDKAEAVAKQDVVKRRLERERKFLTAIDLITDVFRLDSKPPSDPKLDVKAALRAKARKAIQYLETIKGQAVFSEQQAINDLEGFISEKDAK